MLAGSFRAAAAQAASASQILPPQQQLIRDGVPPATVDFSARLSQYLASREANFAGWFAPGQGMLIRTRFDQSQQLHWVQTPAGQRRQLTYGSDPVLNAWPIADPQRPQLLFLRDSGGDEAFQLFHLDLLTQVLSPLSQPPSRQGVVVPAEQGGLFAFYSTARNQRDWDLMRWQLPAAPTALNQELPAASRLQHSPGVWLPLDWSPDTQWLLALEVQSAAVSLPYLVRADGSGERVPLYREGERAAYMDGRFSADGGSIFLLSNRGREFVGLFRLDLHNGELALVLDLPHDIESLAQAPDRNTLALVVNEEGYSRLHLYRLPGLEELASPEVPAGVIDPPRFSSDSRWLGFSLSTPSHPRDVFALEVASGQVQRWTQSELGGLHEQQMHEPRLIHYPSPMYPLDDALASHASLNPAQTAAQSSTAQQREGGAETSRPLLDDSLQAEALEIPAWYYPPLPSADSPAPVVILIHGGPEVQARPRFDPLIQFWNQELGMAVLVPNVRGSQGYGSTYLSLDDGRQREHAVADIGALLDWIATQPELDAERVGVYGASYGGYMVLAALAHYGERIRAGVDLNGISDFVTFLRHTSEYRRQHRRGEYGDERQRAMRAYLRQISPLRLSAHIRSPLLIAQGENDPRVPLAQSEQMVQALRDEGGEVWYLLARDEGHGFRKQSNRIQLQQTVAWFWCRHLLASCNADPASQTRVPLSDSAAGSTWPPALLARRWGLNGESFLFGQNQE